MTSGSVAPQRSLTRNQPATERQRNVRWVVGGETEFLRRNRIVQDENRPGSGNTKRNGLRDGRRYSAKIERRQKDFRSAGTFCCHRLTGHVGQRSRRLGVALVSVEDAIEKSPKNDENWPWFIATIRWAS